MIVEWLVSIGGGFANWVAELFPELDIPDQIANVDDAFNTVMSYGNGLGAFVDFQLVGLIAAVPITVWLGGLAVRGVRVVLSHIPFIGGRG